MLCKQYPSPVFLGFAAAAKRGWKVGASRNVSQSHRMRRPGSGVRTSEAYPFLSGTAVDDYPSLDRGAAVGDEVAAFLGAGRRLRALLGGHFSNPAGRCHVALDLAAGPHHQNAAG